MASTIDLALFKKHVRADDFADDDDYLAYLLETAEADIVRRTQRTEAELYGDGGPLPAPLRHAVMMLAAHWYNQRESVAGVQMHSVPDAVDALVKPFRRLAR